MLNSITKEWVIEFDLFNKERKVKDSSISTLISQIKSIYKEAQSQESLNVKKDNPFANLRTYKKGKKITELTINDLVKMKNLNQNDIPFRKRGNKKVC